MELSELCIYYKNYFTLQSSQGNNLKDKLNIYLNQHKGFAFSIVYPSYTIVPCKYYKYMCVDKYYRYNRYFKFFANNQ